MARAGNTRQVFTRREKLLLTAGKLLAKFGAEATNQFRRKFGDVHSFGDKEFTAENGTALVVISQLAIDLAILAFLIPAETAVRNSFGAYKLESAQKRVAFGHQKSFAEYRNLNQLFIRTKDVC
jgi:hypothetical protein